MTLLIPPAVKAVPEYRRIQVSRVGRSSGQIWEQLELPFHARGGVLFSLVGGAPLLHPRNIITIHDAAVFAAPGGFSLAFRVWYHFLYWALCRTALHVLTVSHFSRAELVKWCGANPSKFTVTYLGSEHARRPEPDPDVLAGNRLRQFKYVLVVGSRNPNKNLTGVIRAIPFLANSGVDIAIAGQNNSKVFGELHISEEQVRDLGYVNDSELRTLYENAACFVFPSFYEGFGLPPLEALALGCPAVVSDSNSLAEIFKSVAFLCNPEDPSDIADKIKNACKAPEGERGRYRKFADGFTWRECATITWDVLSRFAKA